MKSLAQQLTDWGLEPFEAAVWDEFISGVAEALIAAERSLKAAGWSEFCLAAGAFGKPRKKGPFKGQCIPTEEGLSGELTERMKDYLRSVDEDHVLRKWHVSFEAEGRVKSKKKKGKFADRTDIRAIGYRVPAPEFVLEAKIIENEGQIETRLLGEAGLGCFLSSDPYTQSEIGGLIAYTIQDSADVWLARIEKKYVPAIAPSATRLILQSVALNPPGVLDSLFAWVPRKHLSSPIGIINLALTFPTKIAAPASSPNTHV